MVRLKFQQQILTGFIFSLLLVFAIGFNSYQNTLRQEEYSSLVIQTRQVIARANNIYNLILNLETGQRGFIITGQEKFLEPYQRSRDEILPSILLLKEQVKGNPLQTRRADSLFAMARFKVQFAGEAVQKRRQESFESARDFVNSGHGRNTMINIRKIIEQIINAENEQLVRREKLAADAALTSTRTILAGSALIVLIVISMFFFILRTFRRQKEAEEELNRKNLDLEQVSAENKSKNWLLTGTDKVNEQLRGENEVDELAVRIIRTLADYCQACVGAIYLFTEHGDYQMAATYAYESRKGNRTRINTGEGLMGQAAVEKKALVFTHLPSDYVRITSALGEMTPHAVIAVPCMHDEKVTALVELGFPGEISADHRRLLEKVSENIGIAVNAALARTKLRELFEKTQQQAEELEAQQEELRITNEELYRQTQMLQASEEELKVQQEELRQANAELEEKAALLEEKNKAIELGREAVVLKAQELESTSRYKSEFLANMSHELRTPLNSILILARMLSENKNKTLADEEVKYAGVIFKAGQDLLNLINDILDLSKIEAGKVDLQLEEFAPDEVRRDLELLFSELAGSKKIRYDVTTSPDLPQILVSDKMRLEQVLKNLLSNAFKFTSAGGTVSLSITKAGGQNSFSNPGLKKGEAIAFRVSDTGVGIPSDKQQLIFEAFQQADGSTSRKYGGTGLGLSISRELALLLGGELQVESEPGKGSVFTLYIPAVTGNPAQTAPKAQPAVQQPAEQENNDDYESEHCVLIIEDDENFAEVVKGYALRMGFRVMVAHSGERGLELAEKYVPNAIILDIRLPGMDGWEVLKKLKSSTTTRNIPVHIMSAADESDQKAKSLGAISFIQKPVDFKALQAVFSELSESFQTHLKRVLVVEDIELHSDQISALLKEHEITVEQAYSGKEALEKLNAADFDCMVLDLKLPDMNGIDLLEKIRKMTGLENLPVIINTAMELDADQINRVMEHGKAMVMKSNKSHERLLDEINLFFNQLGKKPATGQPAETETELTLHSDSVLTGRKILLVDDDMRNVFALSAALQDYNLKIEIAGNGREALQKLNDNEDIDLVLMDIMMPEMDGYEAMRAIRNDVRWSSLPVIALTAKAMKNDREKCIEAGASDYISKPVDVPKLVSLLRVWLSR